jgi:FKBP-type peptidyl-prolyl cis-trans isomerase 2
MGVGESKTVTLPPEEAFGSVRDDLIKTVKEDILPEDFTPKIGKTLRLKSQDGQHIRAKVIEINDDTVTLDANHPLAGQTFNLDVELVDIL